MLVLSRKVGEEIVIDNRIRVRVVSIQGSRVRLGIEAPQEVPVARPDAKKTSPPPPPSTDKSAAA